MHEAVAWCSINELLHTRLPAISVGRHFPSLHACDCLHVDQANLRFFLWSLLIKDLTRVVEEGRLT